MSVVKIEKIEHGRSVQKAELSKKHGKYICHARGTNMDPVLLDTLDEVASYLRANPGSGVRMNPGWSKVSENIFIDGVAR